VYIYHLLMAVGAVDNIVAAYYDLLII